MYFQILGQICLRTNDGTQAELGAAKNRNLLGLLLFAKSSPVSRDTLISRLWDETNEDRRNAIQGYISRLRSQLGKAGSPHRVLTVGGASYQFEVAPEDVDYHRFNILTAQGRAAAGQGDHSEAIRYLSEAVDLWTGPLLPGLDTNWARRQREAAIAGTLLPAHYALNEAYLASGDHDSALRTLEDLCTEYDTDETLAKQKIRALGESGRAGEIPAYTRAFSQRYRAEVDAEPDEDITAGYLQSIARVPVPRQNDSAPLLVCALPRDTPHFTGRGDLISELDELLLNPQCSDPGAVVALHGAPGAGKTTAAIHWARLRRNHYPDGQFFVDLGGFSGPHPVRPDDALTRLLLAIGSSSDRPPATVDERAALLRQSLTGKRVLVIVDNVANSNHVSPMLAALNPSDVLVTSRQRLTRLVHLEGAHQLRVAVLNNEESGQLLRRRVSRLDEDSADAIIEICGGLPLGLRIVSEHLANSEVPVLELVHQLRENKTRLLDTGGHGDGAPTLRAAFASSYAALQPEIRRFFRLLSLLPTPEFSVAATAAVTGVPMASAERSLESLVGSNLIHQQHADRYQLHDLLYHYAGVLTDTNETAEEHKQSNARLFDWYLQTTHLANRQIAPHQSRVPELAPTTTVNPLTFPDADAALRSCIQERSNLIYLIHKAMEQHFHRHAWRLAAEVGDLFDRFGDLTDMLQVLRLALDATRIAKEPLGKAGTLNNLGTIHYNLGQFTEARKYFRQALPIFQKLKDTEHIISVTHNLAVIAAEFDQFDKALELHRQNLARLEQQPNDMQLASVQHHLGKVYRKMAKHESALTHLTLALNLRNRKKNTRGQADTLNELSRLHLERDEVEVAIAYGQQALDLAQNDLDERGTASALHALAAAHRQEQTRGIVPQETRYFTAS